MKLIKPLPLKDEYYSNIEEEINRLFKVVLYSKLAAVAVIGAKEMRNAVDTPLSAAIKNGLITYRNGTFTGTYSAAITKELRIIGAIYRAKTKSWVLLQAAPPYVSIAQAFIDNILNAKRRDILQTLDDFNIESINEHNRIPDAYNETIQWIEGDFKKTVEALKVVPTLTGEALGILTADYSYNMDLYIKTWLKENITKLRDQVKNHVFAGGRAESLESLIIKNYRVSRNKAKFLARQETSLLLSKYHEQRLKSVGITKYRWSASMDERTRQDHKDLDGRVFHFDTPPVVDKRTGRKANAGEDFGCRCVAVPIIE